MRLVVVRHGEVAANVRRELVGRRDQPLTATGERQVEELRLALERHPLAAVYSSPLRRAVDTARPLAESRALAVTIDPRLTEQSFGAWEGQSWPELARLLSARGEESGSWQRGPDVPPPGGESLAEVEKRVLEVIGELAVAQSGLPVAVVSHVGPIKCLVCRALDLPLDHAHRFFLDPGRITVIDWCETPVLRAFNCLAPLPGVELGGSSEEVDQA